MSVIILYHLWVKLSIYAEKRAEKFGNTLIILTDDIRGNDQFHIIILIFAEKYENDDYIICIICTKIPSV